MYALRVARALALRDGRGHGLQVTCGEVVLDLDQSDSRIVIHIPFLVSESRSLRSERTKIRNRPWPRAYQINRVDESAA